MREATHVPLAVMRGHVAETRLPEAVTLTWSLLGREASAFLLLLLLPSSSSLHPHRHFPSSNKNNNDKTMKTSSSASTAIAGWKMTSSTITNR
ncbi:hypothetical protein KC331_g39 [Hortaea werneckii]|nr:hypothetical protein KC331_g39 [Hortaea werneckii]